MVDNEISRLSRLTAIITLLQTKRLITATEIAKRFDISVRTVYRDIRALDQAGIPVLSIEGKGYSLVDDYKLPPIMFTEAEANALVTAEKLILNNKDASFAKSYSDAIIKIKTVLKYTSKDKVEFLSNRIEFCQNIEKIVTSHHLSTIQLALTNFKLVKLEYISLEKDEITHRIVESFALYSTQDNWILLAYCRLRNDFRAFRLDRIKQIEILNENFEPHKITLQEYFQLCKEKYYAPLT